MKHPSPVAAIAAALLSLGSPLFGAVSVTSTDFTYSQNFDSLPTASSNTTSAWTNNSTLAGWYLHAGGNLTGVTGIQITAGSTSSRSQTSYGAASATERALGSQAGSRHDRSVDYTTDGTIGENTTFGTISAGFTNNSGAPLTGFTFSYTGEQWLRSSSTGDTRDTLTMQWAIGTAAAAPTSLTWNTFTTEQQNTPGVNFTAPQKGGGSAAIDGNNAANRIVGLGAAVSGISWPSGQTLFIRWVDINDSGTDGGLAVDDFSFAVQGLPDGVTTETLVARGANWKYLDNGSDQGTNWRETWFNDATWSSGAAELGYGDDNEATVVGFGPDSDNKYPTTYFRRTFSLADPSLVSALRATLKRDDGAVIYINGREVVRDNMPSGTILYNTYASSPEVNGSNENVFFPHDIDPSFLRAGVNTIAVEIHQQRADSSDISFDMDLIATISEPAGDAPSVEITSPANNATFGKFDSVEFTATASDSDGSITKVEFYRNTTKIGEALSAPYIFQWPTALDGVHAITAIATDNEGNRTISAPITIQATDKPNVGPVLTITSPTDGATYDATETITLNATATDANGEVERISFYQDGQFLTTLFTAPYTMEVGPLFSGTYQFTAIATDDSGETTTESVNVSVTNPSNALPNIALTSPNDGDTLAAGDINLSATASDSDGFITKVEFFVGEDKLGEDTEAPFSITWMEAEVGTYALTAVATDNDGGQSTSAAVNITIVTPPPFAYFENFDSMGTTANSLPSGWNVHATLGGARETWDDTTGIPASGALSAATNGTVNNTLLITSNAASGTINSNTQAYNAALAGSTTDRTLATAPTTGAGLILQLTLENTNSVAISQLRVGYDIRRLRNGSDVNQLPGYWLFYSMDNGSTWTNVSDLNPSHTGGNVQLPNTVGVTSISDYNLTLASAWQPGSQIRFRWVDDNAFESSPDQFIGLDNVSITVPAPIIGEAPVVALTAPANGSSYVGPATIELTANASDLDGTITKVEFYSGGTKLGESTSEPYAFTWNDVVEGGYSITARAIDNQGNLSISTPVSINVTPPPGIASGPWSGNVSHNSATINVTLNAPGIATRAVISKSPDLSNPIHTNTVTTASASGNAVRLDISGLDPLTIYHYAIETNGFLQTTGDLKGKFSTFPAPGVASFRFAFGSCGSYSNSSQYVYEGIVNDDPLFFIHMGDMNYQDINSTNVENYRTVYNAQITTGQLRRVCRAMGMAYMWDDHDYAGNDSNKNNIGRAATRQVYRERFPHYALPAGGPDAAIYQTFNVGRVKYILTDLRSERDPIGNTDNASKSMLGATQKAWFKQELINARDNEVPLIVWNSSVPFISTSTSGDDWGRFQTERREILEFIRDEKIQNLVVISGDMHALALDDGQGTNAYVSGVRIPVFHGAALAQSGSSKGGPYRVGANTIPPNQGLARYGIMDIADDGANLVATFRGRIASGSGSTWTSTADWTFTGSQNQYAYNAEPVRPRVALNATAAPALNSVAITWTDNSSVESGYRIERRPAGNGNFASIGTVAANITSFEDSDVTPATAYDYRIIALNQNIEAASSNIASASTLNAYENFKLANAGDAEADDMNDAGDSDGLGLLMEFAFGLNPEVNDNIPLIAEVPEGTLTTRGTPILYQQSTDTGVDFRALYIRRKNSAVEGIVYTAQFSADLNTWANGTHNPVIIADDGDYELVSVRYPFFVNGRKARFFRIEVKREEN